MKKYKIKKIKIRALNGCEAYDLYCAYKRGYMVTSSKSLEHLKKELLKIEEKIEQNKFYDLNIRGEIRGLTT